MATNEAAAAIAEELAGLDDAAAQAGLQDALAAALQRERSLAAARSAVRRPVAKLRRADEQR
jgi:chromosome segregation protein